MTRKLSVNPYRFGPFLCVLCEAEIAPRRMHVVLSEASALTDASPEKREVSAAPMVCAACMDSAASHAALYPACDRRGCSLADHAFALAPNRAGAVALLIALGRMQPPTE